MYTYNINAWCFVHLCAGLTCNILVICDLIACLLVVVLHGYVRVHYIYHIWENILAMVLW